MISLHLKNKELPKLFDRADQRQRGTGILPYLSNVLADNQDLDSQDQESQAQEVQALTYRDEQLLVVLGSCLGFVYLSYLTAVSIVLTSDSLPLMALCKACYLASSVISINCLLCLGRSAQGNPVDFNSKADLRELTLLTMLSFTIYSLSESGLFLQGLARQLSRFFP